MLLIAVWASSLATTPWHLGVACPCVHPYFYKQISRFFIDRKNLCSILFRIRAGVAVLSFSGKNTLVDDEVLVILFLLNIRNGLLSGLPTCQLVGIFSSTLLGHMCCIKPFLCCHGVMRDACTRRPPIAQPLLMGHAAALKSLSFDLEPVTTSSYFLMRWVSGKRIIRCAA
jgi:hypothetical protein